MKKTILLLCVLAASACTQSRRGIKGAQEDWVWGGVDFCSESNCDASDTHLVGTVHYDKNFIEFEVIDLPVESSVALASDESISYRIIGRRVKEARWRLLKQVNLYSGQTEGYSKDLKLELNTAIRLRPDLGFIEQYDRYMLQRIYIKNNKIVNAKSMFDVSVQFSELEEAN